MRLLVLPLILTALPAAAAPTNAPAAPPVQLVDPIARPLSDACKRSDVYQAETPAPSQSRKLGDLPPGDLILSVYNQVDGCMEPLIVRYGDGRVPAGQAPADLPRRPRAQIWR